MIKRFLNWMPGFWACCFCSCRSWAWRRSCWRRIYNIWLPRDVSEHGRTIDGLFMFILWLTGIVFIATEVALFYFAWKYDAQAATPSRSCSRTAATRWKWCGRSCRR